MNHDSFKKNPHIDYEFGRQNEVLIKTLTELKETPTIAHITGFRSIAKPPEHGVRERVVRCQSKVLRILTVFHEAR